MGPESLMVDSNVFIDFIRAGKDPVHELLNRYDTTDLVTCGVVKMEVLRGIKPLKVRKRVEEFFSIMRYAQTPISTLEASWHLAWSFDRKGFTLPLQGLAIAQCCMDMEAAVLTSDRHFNHVEELAVVRPVF